MPIVIDLGAYAIAIICLALAYIITLLVLALLGWIAHALNVISAGLISEDWVHDVAQACTHAFGVAFGWVDKELGASIHAFARFMDWLWEEVVHAATGYLLLVELVARLVYAHSGLKTLVHETTHFGRAVAARVHELEREWHGIEHRVKTVEREIAHGIGHDLRVGLKATEKELAHVEHVVIPAIEQADRDASAAISDLYAWAKGKASLVGIGTFTVAVTAVLSAVGLDWLACRGRSGVNGKSGCNLWNDIESLLGAAIVTGLALDLPTLIGDAQKATPGIIANIEKLAGLKS